MTYEDYSKKTSNKKNYLKVLLNKLFTVIIFTMLVITISNYSPKFKSFLVDKVLNDSMDFSFFNNIVNKITTVFKSEEIIPVSSNINDTKYEKYLSGVKYIINDNEEVTIKDSGIVTFIGEKDGYNNTIIIQQSNGYYAWYGNIKESVKLYDYIEKGSVIGSASKEYYYVLLKDDKPINIYED